jgi:hypothetical protein
VSWLDDVKQLVDEDVLHALARLLGEVGAEPKVPFPTVAYHVKNIVERWVVRFVDTILLNAHVDLTSDSVGASDNGLGVAASIATARACSTCRSLTAHPTDASHYLLHVVMPSPSREPLRLTARQRAGRI